MRFVLFIFFLLNFSLQIFAQTGTIRGTIFSGKEPVSFARIKLKNMATGAISDSTGFFIIRDLPFGNYVLEVSLLGQILGTES